MGEILAICCPLNGSIGDTRQGNPFENRLAISPSTLPPLSHLFFSKKKVSMSHFCNKEYLSYIGVYGLDDCTLLLFESFKLIISGPGSWMGGRRCLRSGLRRFKGSKTSPTFGGMGEKRAISWMGRREIVQCLILTRCGTDSADEKKSLTFTTKMFVSLPKAIFFVSLCFTVFVSNQKKPTFASK